MNGTTISTLSRKNFNQLLESQEDTKNMIASEEVSPSVHTYQVGNYLIYNNDFYKVIATIRVGDILSTATNISLVNIGEELKVTAGGSGEGSEGAIITPPTLTSSNTFTYDGTTKILTFSGIDTDTMIINKLPKSNAGQYAVAIALKNENDTWSDTNDNVPKIYPWQITKAQPTITASSNTISVSRSTRSQDITITYTGDGVCTCISNDPTTACASIISPTICRIIGQAWGTTSITITAPETSNYLAASLTIDVNSTVYKLYGVEWDGSSSPQMTRTDDSAEFEDPVPAMKLDNGLSIGYTAGSSPFDNLYPWSGIVKEERTGGTMVKIPKFWYKMYGDYTTHEFKLQIADGPVEGFAISPMHIDRSDNAGERDYAYVGRYHCSEEDWKSTSGVKPQVGRTKSNSRSSIHSLGPTIWQWDYTTRVTIWMLYLVEFANWDSQAMIGYGCAPDGSTSAVRNMGYTDAMQYHTGTDQATRDTYGGTQYRWIEGLWDNCFDWVDGIYFYTTYTYIILNPDKFADTTNGSVIWSRPSSSGVPTGMGTIMGGTTESYTRNWFMFPSAVGGTTDTYICDNYVYYNSTNSNALYVGGSYNQHRSWGLFFLSGYYGADNTSKDKGSRLMELPV